MRNDDVINKEEKKEDISEKKNQILPKNSSENSGKKETEILPTLEDENSIENSKKIKIALRLPDGKKIQRNFHESNTLMHILAFLVENSPEISEKNLWSKIIFSQNFPLKKFPLATEGKKTLKELQIGDQTVLFIEFS
jgi:hypothetical protein